MRELDKVLIIAEAGVNHNGDLNVAKELIEVASNAGVDFVKFQTFKAADLVTKKADQAEYQKKNSGNNSGSQFDMLRKLELSHDDHTELMAYAKVRGIQFFSTAFDVKGLNYLNEIGFTHFKIPSGEITNYPYLERLAAIGKPVILSTGMADMAEISDALKVLQKGIEKKNITILHCNTEYPTPMEDVNLKAMISIKEAFDIEIGYSDHTLGIEVPIAAVSLGAKVIEKHFTLDRNLPGPDHRASLEPNELKAMVQSIRNIEKAISGDGIKKPSKSELKNKDIARKSLHLSRDIAKGTIIDELDLIPLRPGNGISPMEWDSIIGKKAIRNLTSFQLLRLSDLE